MSDEASSAGHPGLASARELADSAVTEHTSLLAHPYSVRNNTGLTSFPSSLYSTSTDTSYVSSTSGDEESVVGSAAAPLPAGSPAKQSSSQINILRIVLVLLLGKPSFENSIVSRIIDGYNSGVHFQCGWLAGASNTPRHRLRVRCLAVLELAIHGLWLGRSSNASHCKAPQMLWKNSGSDCARLPLIAW